MIWGEWSRVENFRPLKPNNPGGARIYANILDTSYGALKQANRRNIVIGGMTLNGGTLKPPQVVKYMKLKNGRPPRMDLWGTNPFDARFPHLADEPDRALPWLQRHRHPARRNRPRLPARQPQGPAPLDLRVDDRLRPAPAALQRLLCLAQGQAQRLSAAFTIAARTPYVAGMGWFTLLDELPGEGEHAGWGLLDADGIPKPSFFAYKALP